MRKGGGLILGEDFPGSVPKTTSPAPRKGRGGGKARGHAPFEQVLDGARRGAEPKTGRAEGAEPRLIKWASGQAVERGRERETELRRETELQRDGASERVSFGSVGLLLVSRE